MAIWTLISGFYYFSVPRRVFPDDMTCYFNLAHICLCKFFDIVFFKPHVVEFKILENITSMLKNMMTMKETEMIIGNLQFVGLNIIFFV